MKRIYTIPILLVAFVVTLSAQSVKEADELYAKEQYKEAVEQYKIVADSIGVSPELYYNMANSYYKLKEYPKAVLYYEKALLLSPADDDIRTNLEMARANIVDKIDVVDRTFVSLWFEDIINIAKSDSWAISAIASFIIFLVGLFLYIFNKNVLVKKIGFFSGVVLLLFSIFANYASYKQKQKIEVRNSAIIMVPSITVKSSPANSGTDLFILHEGTKVKVTDKVGEWSEIKIADGNSGWIPTSKMEII